ncbi:MAG: IS5 family transposase [Sulfitobacter sp.]
MGCKSRPTPPTYKTRNWPAYNEELKRRGSLTIWFDPEIIWEATLTCRRGRQQTYSDPAIQTCFSMKVLFGMALRQTTGFVESLLRLVGVNWKVPDFSTLSRRQKTLAVKVPYRDSTGPLHLLIDSTGIKVEGEGEWHARKHGGPKRRVWRKIHLGIDEKTMEVRAVEITGSHIGDAPILPDLLSQIPAEEQIGSVTADGDYDTRYCHDAIARNEALRASRYLGRAIWRNWSGYYRRSRVETKMHCMKLLGQRLMARDFDRQVAEVQIRIAFMNGYTALGIPVTEAVG